MQGNPVRGAAATPKASATGWAWWMTVYMVSDDWAAGGVPTAELSSGDRSEMSRNLILCDGRPWQRRRNCTGARGRGCPYDNWSEIRIDQFETVFSGDGAGIAQARTSRRTASILNALASRPRVHERARLVPMCQCRPSVCNRPSFMRIAMSHKCQKLTYSLYGRPAHITPKGVSALFAKASS